ncbi:MAG: hypothetical protein WA208_18080 [Thermoanaerobaculia bacterium]
MLMNAVSYIPGVCNIGPAEIATRRQVGWGGLIATIFLVGFFIWFDVPPLWRLTLFFPTAVSASGFLQATMHFCAYFGFASLFNVGPDLGATDTVQQAEFRAYDRRKAWQIVGFSILIAGVVALLAALLPTAHLGLGAPVAYREETASRPQRVSSEGSEGVSFVRGGADVRTAPQLSAASLHAPSQKMSRFLVLD